MEPGLVSRKVVAESADRVVIREEWDLSVQGCPFVAVRRDVPSARWMRELIMSPDEFRQRKPEMK